MRSAVGEMAGATMPRTGWGSSPSKGRSALRYTGLSSVTVAANDTSSPAPPPASRQRIRPS